MRLWMSMLFGTFVLFQLATVFAAPSPLIGITASTIAAQANVSYLPRNTKSSIGLESRHDNSTVSRNVLLLPERQRASQEGDTTLEDTNQKSTVGTETQTSLTGREANIAYFLQVSESTLLHLPRLLDSIYHPRNTYAIHFDLKVPRDDIQKVSQQIRTKTGNAGNIHIMPSELITYRGVSMLLNTINAMRLLLDEDETWDYFINISGSDYPLLGAETQRRLLGRELGLNYFTFAPRSKWDQMAENRMAEIWFDESLSFRQNAASGELQKLAIRNPLVDTRQFDITHAEAWMISSREFCDFVVKGDMARKMLVAFSYAADSSEHYFASLAWNHEKFRKTIVTHSMRMVVWNHEGKASGQHPYYIDERKTNDEYRFKDLIDTSVLFFARKFKDPDSDLMNYIDERAKRNSTITAAENHLVSKVGARFVRLREL